MSDYKNLIVTTKGEILFITLNRPEKLNALNQEMLSEIKVAIRKLYMDNTISGAIFLGNGGKAFAAGADIEEMLKIGDINARKYSEFGQEVFNMIEKSSKPIIAAIDGFALGGGLELGMSCHIRFCTQESKLGLPEVNLGIIPAFGGTQRLTRAIGRCRALEMMFTGKPIDAQTAYNYGLVNRVCSKETLLQEATELIENIITKSKISLGCIVESVNSFYEYEEDGYQTESNAFLQCCKTEDFKEGIKAFLEKRKPVFKGK